MIRSILVTTSLIVLAGCVTVRSGADVTPRGAAAVAQPAGGLSASILPTLNAFRSANGVKPLADDARLALAATNHAADMTQNSFFSHTGSNGSSVGQRVKAIGYGFCFVAENIAQGQTSADEAFASWQNSAGHRKNMLSQSATQVGFARSGNTWVMVLGKPGC